MKMFQVPLFMYSAYFIISARSQQISQPSYVISGGKVVRPGQLYSVSVYFCYDGRFKFSAGISRSGAVVASATLEFPSGGIYNVPLKIPLSAASGDYKLLVEGQFVGTSFAVNNSTQLEFNNKFVAIIIHTSRPIYRASQTIKFRILILETDLSAFDDAVEVYIIDSDGFIMRRWLSVYTNNGVASLEFTLPNLVKEGNWKIRVKVRDQIEDLTIKVENYFPPMFEVFVELQPYMQVGEESMIATIYGMFTTQEYIRGNATIQLYDVTEDTRMNLIWEKKAFIKGPEVLSIPLAELNRLGKELRLETSVTDILYGATSTGFAKTKIISKELQLRFLAHGVMPFKSLQQFVVYLSLENEDGWTVSSDILTSAEITVQSTSTLEGGQVLQSEQTVVYPPVYENISDGLMPDTESVENFPETGILGIKVHPAIDARLIELRATVSTQQGTKEANLICAQVSNDKQLPSISVSTSTSSGAVDEYAIFHVATNVFVSSFQYLVISKNNVINSGDISINAIRPTTTTFSLPLSSDMAPGFRLFVFAIFNEKIISDSIFMPLNAFNRYETILGAILRSVSFNLNTGTFYTALEMELTMNTAKDFKGDSVEVIVSGDEGAYISVHSVRSLAYKLQAGNEMTLSRVTDSLMSLERDYKMTSKVRRRSWDGETPQETSYFQSGDYGRNTNHSFILAGLVVFTNLLTTNESPHSSCEDDEFSCLGGRCYNSSQICDGIKDCSDSSDEMNCESVFSDDYEFTINRISRSTFLYDAEDGDWAWREIKKNDHEGIEFEPVDAPFVADDWYINAFSVSTKYGFSILESPVVYSTKRGFTAHLSGPNSCRRGEQIGLRLLVYNHDPTQNLILVTVQGSDDYKFVEVGSGGTVSSYSAKLTGFDHQILVYVPGGRQERLDIPIAPTVEKGDIEINVIASSQAGRSTMVHPIKVLPEGAQIIRHTSSILDLKNRAYVLQYMDIPIEESPLVPYQIWRRYIFGSPQGSVRITGDIIGPIVPPEDITMQTMLGRQGKGTDARLFEFACSILTLNYRRVTTTIRGFSEVRERLEAATVLYANAMKRYHTSGYFTNWDLSHPSVWLTAWAVRILRQANYADWENILYVDRNVFDRALLWIVKWQGEDGSFAEYHVEDNFIDSNIPKNTEEVVILTAHVVISLIECTETVEGETRTQVTDAASKGIKYLESKYTAYKHQDPYCLALLTWAFKLAKSNHFGTAYNQLMNQYKTNRDGLVYWSERVQPPGPIKIENQRPFLGPRLYSEGDSRAVETTAYVLMIILGKDGLIPIVEKLVLWLNTIRMTNNGFISMTDTVLAMQALIEYAYHSRIMALTKIEVKLNSAMDPEFNHVVHLTNESIVAVEPLELGNVWGHVNVVAKGAGLALLQMDLSYGVDVKDLVDKPSEESFDLKIREVYWEDRNKSAITIEACTKWLRSTPPTSGAAALEVDIPTGYHLVESEAEKIANSSSHPTLRDAKTGPMKTIWFFDEIAGEWHCFNHTIRRWFPVANMTLHRQAIIYEINARERFKQELINSTPLYLLSICEVCGSYQCPYCPYYNYATTLTPHSYAFLFFAIAIIYFKG